MTNRRLLGVLLAVFALLGATPAIAAQPAVAAGQKTVIFDMDDTLIATQRQFERGAKNFQAFATQLGFDGPKAKARMEELDLENVKTMGVSSARIGTSMEMAIMELSGDPKVGRQARAIGERIFTSKEKTYPNTRKVMTEYRKLGYRVIVLTKGDDPIQKARVARSGLADLVDHVEIVPTKTSGSYAKLIRRFKLDPRRTFVIGNSYKSDIVTAHQAGIPSKNTVWMSGRVMWSHELAGLPANANTTTRRATSLPDALRQTKDQARRTGGRPPRDAASGRR